MASSLRRQHTHSTSTSTRKTTTPLRIGPTLWPVVFEAGAGATVAGGSVGWEPLPRVQVVVNVDVGQIIVCVRIESSLSSLACSALAIACAVCSGRWSPISSTLLFVDRQGYLIYSVPSM